MMKKKINGTEYTFQKLPAMEMVRLKERATDTSGNLVESLLFEELAEHVIVNPRLDLEEFEDYGELMEIMKVALDFQLSKSGRKGESAKG
jgi:hypothetical protein